MLQNENGPGPFSNAKLNMFPFWKTGKSDVKVFNTFIEIFSYIV